MRILDFDYACCIEDVLIAAVALSNDLQLATGNPQDSSRIAGLTLLTA